MLCGVDEQERRRVVNDALRHDTRNWLGIGKGYTSMLRSHYDALTPQQRERALDGLSKAFDRLDAFTRGVLLDEQLQTREVTPNRGESEVAFLLSPAKAYAGVTVEAPAGTVNVDPVMVREVVDQLVRNAVTAGSPPVTVRASADGGCFRIEVRDTGATIEPGELLFERYAVTRHARETGKAGMGLGLSIVRRYAEAHGGTCGVRLGDGTTFWVELPT